MLKILLASLVLAGTPTSPGVQESARVQGPESGQVPEMDQTPVMAGGRTDSLRAFLVTFGPGAAVWERFGHNALWIHNPRTGSDTAYHYGLFDMSEEGFLLHFLQGRMSYSMGSAPADRLIEAYRRYGRDATVQELRLTVAQIQDLEAFLEWNLRPENRVYRYDYFRDNCSTRIRDALDRVTGGAIREALGRRPSPLTYREQAVALTAEDWLLTTGMDLGLGPLADQPITRWDLAFIPMRLRDDLRTLTVRRNGDEVGLVATEQELPAAGDEDELAAVAPDDFSAHGRALLLLLIGTLGGGLLGIMGHRLSGASPGTPSHGTPSHGIARWTLAIGGTLWGLVSGLLGVILLALWTLTDHEFAWRNENLLQTNPLGLALVVLVPIAVLGRRRRAAAAILALVLGALSIIGLLIHPLPLTRQDNLAIIALTLPVHVGLAWGLWRLER